MAYIPDLTPCRYFPLDPQGKLIAVGWLDRRYPYPRGTVPQEVIQGLWRGWWEPFRAMGYHQCEFCEWEDPRIRIGCHVSQRNLFIPGDQRVYVAPELILHYIEDHCYCPPRRFQEAVLACPDSYSQEYFERLERNGPKSLRKYITWAVFQRRRLARKSDRLS